MNSDSKRVGLDHSLRPKGIDWSEFDWDIGVRTMVAVLLWAAALAKGYQLATTVVEGSRIALIAQVEIEWLMGLLLISGVWSRTVRLLTILVFSAMACYSAWLITRHVESCGCFGLVRVNPWWTLAIDCLVVIALLAIGARSKIRRIGPRIQSSMVFLVAIGVGIPTTILMASFQPATLSEEGL